MTRRPPRAPRAKDPPVAPIAPPPPLTRDRWAWAATLAVLPLVIHAWGAPLGEPVADDFDCLHRVFFGRGLPLFDGFGSAFYWRPLSRQLYFTVLAPVLVAQPWLVAGLHALMLAATALLLYRALRPRLSGPLAAFVASFPLLMESTRMLIAWPSNFQDLGAMLFAALAIHEAAKSRLATTLVALAASLLCKEMAAFVAPLLAWLPPGAERRPRVRWLIAIAALVAVWGAGYALVHAQAHLAWPAPVAGAARASWLARLWWAGTNAKRAAFSIPVVRASWEPVAAAVMIAFGLGPAVRFVMHEPSRVRLRAMVPLILWGSVWFTAGVLSLAPTYPDWSAYRAAFPAIGLGVALAALFGAAHPAFAAGLFALRLALFAVSPGPPARVTVVANESGAFFDFEKLTRVQRLVGDTHRLLQSRLPSVPHGARIGLHYLPLMTEYAFLGDRGLQVWYRDTTLHWIHFSEMEGKSALALATIVEYEPDHTPQVALVDPAAMQALLDGVEWIRRNDWHQVVPYLDRADSLQRDPNAVVFRGTVAAKRALAYVDFKQPEAAEREAMRALALWRDNYDSRYALAAVWAPLGRLAQAEAQLDTLIETNPADRGAVELRARIREERARRRR